MHLNAFHFLDLIVVGGSTLVECLRLVRGFVLFKLPGTCLELEDTWIKPLGLFRYN